MNELKPDSSAIIGQKLFDLVVELYPICRSITGDGVRQTLRLLQKRMPLEIFEVPSGTPVFDWTVPLEWNVSDAYIKNREGVRVVDFKSNNLHLMSYSTPLQKRLNLEDLKPHLFTLPDYPDWIPYRTSYYQRNWGFCLSHNDFTRLADTDYDVMIDTTLQPGSLTYAESYLPGQTSDEILISCHTCHPSLCNDNLSGIAVAVMLAQAIAQQQRRYSYRFLFIPGTIGSITWLAQNEQIVSRIKHGIVLTGVGDAGGITYKRSRQGDAEIDRAVAHVLKHSNDAHTIIDFFPYGYDERQYCSPAFNLPVGSFMRTPHGKYPEYHSSADNLDFIKPDSLSQSYARCLEVFDLLEGNRTFMNQNPKCEPQLGRRGLYRSIAGQQDKQMQELALLWVLNWSDGHHTLLDIADHADVPFHSVRSAAKALLEVGLLKEWMPNIDAGKV
jgi:aminopeptidase-like protein